MKTIGIKVKSIQECDELLEYLESLPFEMHWSDGQFPTDFLPYRRRDYRKDMSLYIFIDNGIELSYGYGTFEEVIEFFEDRAIDATLYRYEKSARLYIYPDTDTINYIYPDNSRNKMEEFIRIV